MARPCPPTAWARRPLEVTFNNAFFAVFNSAWTPLLPTWAGSASPRWLPPRLPWCRRWPTSSTRSPRAWRRSPTTSTRSSAGSRRWSAT
eukprot:6372002-Pyramimonas_sp.AAC.1